MKTHYLLLSLALCMMQIACVGPIVKKPDGTVMVGGIVGTDAGALVVDGPLPQVIGFAPVYDKKGVIVGQREVYGAGTGAEKALFAAYGLNQSNTLIQGFKELRTFGIGKALAEVAEASNANDAANAGKEIDAAASVEKTRMANEAARDAQAHAEKMAEIPIPPAP